MPFNSSVSYNESIAVLNRVESSAIASSISLAFLSRFSIYEKRDVSFHLECYIHMYHADVKKHKKKSKYYNNVNVCFIFLINEHVKSKNFVALIFLFYM